MRKTLLVCAVALLGLAGIALGTLPFVPAAYLARALGAASGGRLVLAESDGTVWSGRARLAFASGGQTEAARYAVLPGHVRWRVDGIGVAPPRVALAVGGDGAIVQPFRVLLGPGAFTLEPGAIRADAGLLEAAGAPFNTLKPGGVLAIAWDTLSWRRAAAGAGFGGVLTLEWQDARSALSSVVPLGSYRLTARGDGAQVGLDLATTKGPLLLSGNGLWTSQRGVQFRGEARAEAARRSDLGPLIGLLGRPTASGAELRFGS